MKFKENDLMVLRNKTISDDIVLKHEGIFGIRQLLSSKKNPPIQMIIDAGLIDYLMQYVNQN